jgi:two-component system, chemotaxis family, protein-glutamate methylesterase/glutaminase
MSAAQRLEEEEIELHAGECAFYCRSTKGGESSIFVLSSLSPFGFEKGIQRASEMLNLAISDLTLKVLGSQSVCARGRDLALSFGLKVEKTVIREGSCLLVHSPRSGRLLAEKLQFSSSDTRAPEAVVAPVRVLVVDDSNTIRGLLKRMIEADGKMTVVASAERPSQVEELIEKHKPDAITLDIHMPEEDGVSLLRRILPKYGVPTVMVSAISLQEGRHVLEALEIGAVDYVQKPSFSEIESLGPVLREKIAMAAKTKMRVLSQSIRNRPKPQPTGAMDPEVLVLLGASTGGTEALKQVLMGLPREIPPILIVQHIPPVFSKAFADRMNQLCPFEVLEGSEDGMEVRPGRVIVAAGGTQMGLKKGSPLRISVDAVADPVNRHKPSVDFLFDSVNHILKNRSVVAGLLTGMGADGAKGLLGLRKSGHHTLAQDEATSIVFGMPKEAIALGGAEAILPLGEVAHQLVEWCKKK